MAERFTDELDLTRDGPATAPARQRTQVLSLSGGGYRGLYSAHFLSLAERHFKVGAADGFAVVIGTSIGALIASALALGVPAATVAAKIVEHGPRIFPNGGSKAVRAKQYLWEAPYAQKPLREAVVDTVGAEKAKTPLSNVRVPLAICAVNHTHGRPEIFRSRGLARRHASKVPVIDAVLASAAAPTYFPVHFIGGESLLDGGLIANAPDMQGVTEALTVLHRPLDDIYVLAIGTAARRQGAALREVGAPSAAKWAVSHGLVDHILSAQAALAREQCAALLRDRYLLVDNEPAEEQVPAIARMDLTSREATTTLISLAEASWQDVRRKPAFRRFFSTPRPARST